MTITRLPDAPWRQSPGLRAIITALSDTDQQPRIVGGAVRDSLLGLDVADIDLATPLTPAQVINRLEAAGIKAIPTGIDHGTITAFTQIGAHGQAVEVTTLRRDVSTDGRRATVAFSTDWRQDAARRDFTINALYADYNSGEIFDYFNGLSDLQAGKVRFIGDAATRIAEDYLRILRFFRFHARFNSGVPDPAATAACAAAAKSLMALSRERIADELMKLLSLNDPSASVDLMVKHRIFAAFIPEITADCSGRLSKLIQREQAAGIVPLAARRLNALLPSDSAIVDVVAARLKLSNKTRADLSLRCWQTTPSSKSAKAIAYTFGKDICRDIFLLHGAQLDWQDGISQLHDWEIPVFPIKGGDLIKRGLTAGPLVAKTLQATEKTWVETGFPSTADTFAIADQLIAAALSDKNE
jgi:poly(A) polymerase